MSYLALARKYRPRRFEDVMGQDHVVRALSHALSQDRLHPAILLTGTRGVGKTTIARIIAKSLNCEKGVSANPCGVCSVCREVDEGRSVDLLEIDAASNTSVDDVRQVIENAQYAPAGGRYKVYLIDEVHMLSKAAFNALLKTLEEPPSHIKFVLATTDPQKLLVTVLSRCLQFNLKRLPNTVIRDQLAKVLDAEGVAYELPALTEMARAADGSMRDGLSLLDQAIAFSGGQMLARGPVEEMLGTSGRQTLFQLLASLAAKDTAALLALMQNLEMQSPDFSALLNELAAHLQRIAVLQLLPDARSEDDDAALVDLKDQFTPEDTQLYYQIVITGRRDLPWAPDPRLGFEMTLLRMMAFRMDEPTVASAPRPAAAPAVASRSAAPPPATVVAPVAPKSAPVVQLSADASWEQRVDALPLDGFAKQLARNCVWAMRRGTDVVLTLADSAQHLLQEERRAVLERALSSQLGEAIKLTIDVAKEAVLTPAQLTQRREKELQQSAEQAIAQDPGVQAFKDMFGATVKPGSITPIKEGK